MAEVMPWWNNYEVQILVLASLVLQLFLLMVAGMRRRNIPTSLWLLIWLAYLLADSVTIYALGYMSFRSRSHEHQQLVAFWAPFLLVHLGGQDTITALDMEDNQLWLRHLLNLVVQTVGVAYVLYKYIAGTSSKTLLRPAVMVLLAGFLKYGDRVWALKSSSLYNINKFLDDVERPRVWGALQFQEWPYHPVSDAQWIQSRRVDSEEVLQGAHYLLPICLGQLVDYKFWPSPLQSKAIMLFWEKGCMYELIEMQLSLMHELLYTKAAVVHTWPGYLIRDFSLAAIIFAFFQFQYSTRKNYFNSVDAIFTYILLAGALLLEMATVLRAIVSSWTCALLSARRWHRLHGIAVWVQRCIKAAEWMRWSGSIGRRKLLILEEESDHGDLFKTTGRKIQRILGLLDLWDKQSNPPFMISMDIKELVLKEIIRMVEACEGDEEIMRTYNGQCALKPYEVFLDDCAPRTHIDFDNKIVIWHCATQILLLFVQERHDTMVKAVGALSSYMMFLLVERPSILPSPVRSKLYGNLRMHLPRHHVSDMEEFIEGVKMMAGDSELSTTLVRGAELARRLLEMEQQGKGETMQVVLGVWVEMMCYAAHHCSRDSHARLLHRGGEFITIVWLLSTAIFNHYYRDELWFKERMRPFTMGCILALFHRNN